MAHVVGLAGNGGTLGAVPFNFARAFSRPTTYSQAHNVAAGHLQFSDINLDGAW
jgi:hypothetical protein